MVGNGLSTVKNTKRNVALAALVAACVGWGLSYPLMTMTQKAMIKVASIGTLGTADLFAVSSSHLAVRWGVAFLILPFMVPASRGGFRLRIFKCGLLMGGLCGIAMVVQAAALHFTTSARVAFLTLMLAVFVPFMELVAWRRIPDKGVVGGLALAIAGAAVLTKVWAGTGQAGFNIGDSLALVGAFFFALHVVLVEHFGKQFDAVMLIPGTSIALSLFSLVVVLVVAPFSTSIQAPHASLAWLGICFSPRIFVVILLTALLVSVAGQFLMSRYQPSIRAGHAGVIYTSEPIFAAAFAAFVPGILSGFLRIEQPNEVPGWNIYAGGLLMILGIAFVLTCGKPEHGGRETVEKQAGADAP